MKSLTLPLLLLGAAILALGGCGSVPKPALPKGSSEGYSSYRLYRKAPDQLPEFASRKEVGNRAVQDAIHANFQANGLAEAGMDADLVVSYLILLQNTAVSTSISEYYINSESDILSYAHQQVSVKGKYPSDFAAGTLVIDIVDVASRKVIFRNYVSRELLDDLTNEERVERIEGAVAEVLAEFFN